MEKYESPEVEFVEMEEDIVTASGSSECSPVFSCPNAYDA